MKQLGHDLISIRLIHVNRDFTFKKEGDYKGLIKDENDITEEIKNEIKSVKKIGGKIIYTKDITFSSSKLINTFRSAHSSSKNILNRIKKNNTFCRNHDFD